MHRLELPPPIAATSGPEGGPSRVNPGGRGASEQVSALGRGDRRPLRWMVASGVGLLQVCCAPARCLKIKPVLTRWFPMKWRSYLYSDVRLLSKDRSS